MSDDLAIHKDWFYFENEQQVGPIPTIAILALVAQGKVNNETLVWTHGLSDWVKAKDTGLAAYLKSSCSTNVGSARILQNNGVVYLSLVFSVVLVILFGVILFYQYNGIPLPINFSSLFKSETPEEKASRFVEVEFLIVNSIDVNSFIFTNKTEHPLCSLAVYKNSEPYPFINIDNIAPGDTSIHNRNTYIPKLTLADKIRLRFYAKNRIIEAQYYLARSGKI